MGTTSHKVVLAILVGVILGYYYDRTQNLWGATPLHNIIDVTNVVVPLLLVH